MITAVIDTNILASGSLAQTGSVAEIMGAIYDGRFRLAISEHILTELMRTLESPYFAQRLSAKQIATFVSLLRAIALVVTPTPGVAGVATHPEDDIILATAAAAGADYVVTGDKHLQNVGGYGAIRIIATAEFAAMLGGHPGTPAP